MFSEDLVGLGIWTFNGYQLRCHRCGQRLLEFVSFFP
jgi:hypothetical protein